MENKVAISPLIPDPPQAKPPAIPVEQVKAPEAPRSDAADLRLVIEEGPVNGSYVYKTVDRRTGEVLQQLPREDVLRMRETDDYMAGDVFKTEA